MKKLLKVMFILALVLCFAVPVFAIKILPYNVPLQDLMRWDKYGATLRLSNPEGENLTVAWPTTVDLWNYDGSTWTFNLPSGDTFAFGKGIGITGDILMTTTSKIQFHDTGIYINATGDGRMAISSDYTLTIDVTDSAEITVPILEFISATVIQEYDAASFVTTTVSNAGVVLVSVTGDSTGTYEIATDDGAITLDAATTIALEAGAGTFDFSATTLAMNALTITEAGDITANTANGFALIDEAVSTINPTLVPDRRDESTGIGFDSPEVVVVVINATEEYRFEATELDMNDNALSEVGLLTSSGGIVLEDDVTIAFGTGSDVAMDWDNTRGALVTAPAGNFVSPEGMSDRFRLEWVAGQRGKPGMNADIADSAEFATLVVTDPDFEILGTGSSNDDVTFYAEGGIVLETDGSDGDEEILLPHLTANQSAWEQVTWGTDNEVRWESNIRTGDSIEMSIIWAGLKLTNTEVMVTDDDQLYFRYESDVNTGEWQAITTVNGGGDDAEDTDVAVAIDTNYHLVIEIDNTGIASFYIDGALVETGGTFAGNHADLIPYIGVAEDGASAARSLVIRGQVISREYD